MVIHAFIPSGLFPQVLKDVFKKRQARAKLLREQMKQDSKTEVEFLVEEYIVLCDKLNKTTSE